MSDQIKIFITGGTIDGLEYDSEDNAPTEQNSIVPKLLKQSRLTIDYSTEALLFKDSKFVTDDDRRRILKACQECEENKIIITHGTMTMPKTAKFLGQNKLDKTIVLLGSAVPAKERERVPTHYLM